MKKNESISYEPPSWDEWFMKRVYGVAEKSKDPSTKIGAILVKEKHSIIEGFNGFPMKVKDLTERYSDRSVKYIFIAHAEANAISTAARFGIMTQGSTLYCNAMPCSECAKMIIQGGIEEVIVHKQWPMNHSKWTESFKYSKQMFREAGVKIKVFDKKLNLTGYLDGKMINV